MVGLCETPLCRPFLFLAVHAHCAANRPHAGIATDRAEFSHRGLPAGGGYAQRNQKDPLRIFCGDPRADPGSVVTERDDVPVDFGPVLALYGLTGLLAAAGTLRFVVLSPTVESETVHAALSAYLLAGLFFGVI